MPPSPSDLQPPTWSFDSNSFDPPEPVYPAATPGLILIHGGGFSGGTRFNARLIQICEDMAKRGWTCVSIDYRLSGNDPVIFPPNSKLLKPSRQGTELANDPTAVAAASEDAWAAYQWMVTQAASLGIDPNRIGVGGSSAGAVTALIAGYIFDDLGIAAKGDIDAVFDMWGSLGATPVIIQGDDPPLMIAHGEDDSTVPVSGAYALRDQAELVGLPHEIHVFPNTGHGFDIYTYEVAPGESTFQRFVSFFYQHVALEEPVAVPSFSIWSLILLIVLILSAAVFQLGRGTPLRDTKF